MKNQSAESVQVPGLVANIAGFMTVVMLLLSILAVAGKLQVFQLISIERALGTLGVIGLASFVCRKALRVDGAIILLPVLFSLYSGNILALFGWLLFSASSFFLGSFIISQFAPASVSNLGVVLPFLRFCIGLTLNSYLTWVAMHFPVNTSSSYWLFYSLEALVFGFLARRPGHHLSGALSSGQWVVVAHFLLFLPFALVPSYNFDDVAVHLFIPHQTKLFGQFSFSTDFVGGFNPSMVPMGAFTSAFFLGAENAARLVNLSMYSVGLLVLEALTRQFWGGRSSLLAVLFASTVPFTQWILGICFVDSFFFLFSTLLLATVAMLLCCRDEALLPWIGLVVGLGYLVKQQVIFLAIPLCVPVALVLLPQLLSSPRRVIAMSAVAGCLFIGLIAAPLTYNFVVTGNPLFPFYNSIFHSPFWPWPDLVDSRWKQPFALETLWSITFQGSGFIENIDFSFGFTLLVLSPAIVLVGAWQFLRGRREILTLLVLLLAYGFLTYATTGLYMRYLTGVIAAIALLAALVTNSLLSQGAPLRWAMTGVVATIIAGNFAALVSTRNLAGPYPIFEALTGSFTRSTMSYHVNFKRLFQRANELCGRESLGLLIDSPANYLAETRIVSNSWHFPMVSAKLAGAASPAELEKLVFNEMSVCYLIMPLAQGKTGVNVPEFREHLREVDRTVDYGLFVPQ